MEDVQSSSGMRVYTLRVTTPPNTFGKAPLVTVQSLLDGYLRCCSVMFYDGCLYAVGFRLYTYGMLVIPANSGAWVVGNNERIEFTPELRLPSPGYKVEIETCNYAVDYKHAINISLGVGL
jgi:hypothetical protein